MADAQQHLAAIVFADVAGYTKLMEADEAGTYSAWRAARDEIVAPTVGEHKGRIVKFTGDGFLAEFQLPDAALACAVALQQGFAGREPLKLRIGIHLGQIYAEGDDIYGDGVNVAARLEGLAEHGGICVSGAVRDLVHKKMPLGFIDGGKQALKHIAEPMQVWRVRVDGVTEAGPSVMLAEGQSALAGHPSIAVLPFVNMSGDPEQEYFADGMVEEIITGLSRIRWLDVIARNSSFIYKGKPVDIREVGHTLGVRYVLEGSVRKGGDKLRITGQLVEAESGKHLWAEKFDGALADVFDLQDQITASVVGAIEPNLRKAEIERAKRKRPDNLDAYDLYLRALGCAYLSGNETAALDLLQQALQIAPDYAEAHGIAAWQYARRYTLGHERDEDDRGAALRHARAALAGGSEDPATLAYAGRIIGLVAGEVDAALLLLERALTLNPNCVVAHNYLAQFHKQRGDYQRSLTHAELSLRLSPFDPARYVAEEAISEAKYNAGDYHGALNAARSALHSNHGFIPALVMIVACCERLGQHGESEAAVAKMRTLDAEVCLRHLHQWMALSTSPQFDSLAADLRAAGVPE